ncbi:hypothetical protein [Bacillus atrophaeus]
MIDLISYFSSEMGNGILARKPKKALTGNRKNESLPAKSINDLPASFFEV